MNPVIALLKGLGELRHGESRKIVWTSIGLSILSLALLTFILGAAIAAVPLTGIEGIDRALEILGAVGSVVLAWLMFPLVATAFVGFFLDRLAENIEKRDYPDDPPGKEAATGRALTDALVFFGTALALNIVAFLAVLLLSAATGGVAGILSPFVYFVLNGWLVAREFFDAVGARHADRAQIKAWRAKWSTAILTVGLGLAMLLLLPFFNLFAPVIGVAAMVHMVKGLKAAQPGLQ